MSLQAAAWSLGCGGREGGERAMRGAPSPDSAGSAPGARAGASPENPFSGRWMGDDFTAGHRLRDGQLPTLAKRGRRVMLLEQARVPGGNAKSAKWAGVEYSIGAAYFTRPDPGSALETLYREIGVLDRAVKVPKGEALFGGRMMDDFWSGETDPPHAAATRRVRDAWRAIYETRYPEIPWTPRTRGWTRAQFESADREPFAHLLETLDAPPQVRMFCEYYCWSSFGGSASEVSSYAALNFLTAEFGDILALRGGNAGIAYALVADLERMGASFATGRLAASVKQSHDGVEVIAVRGDEVERYPARAAVLAIPRFIAKRVVENFPDDRAAIAASMKWRAYLVANVLLARRPRTSWYDAYRLEPLDPHTSSWTDLILADFVASRKGEHSVITAYRALPFDGGRAELLTDGDHPRHHAAIRRDLLPWLDALGLAERDIVDINLARWGHPLVLAQPGQLAGGALDRLSAPLGRVAFAQQDRYGVPAIENAIAAGFAAADEVEAMLG